jgi:flagellar M-ring protein FliF
MTGGSRLAVTLAGLAVACGLVIFLALSAKGPQYTTIYRNLDAADASAMVEILDQQKVPYRIAEGGTSLEVLPSEADRVRLLLAGQGLPRGGSVGFEILDKTSIGSSESERHTNYVRALQGELSRTLLSVAQVEQARVHIVLPEASLFVSQNRSATAAVLLKLRPMAKLEPEQVQGIIHLIAHSVEGLNPENVTVVDFHGHILSAGILDLSPQGQDAWVHRDVLRQFQYELQSSVETLMEQVFGPGNVLVRVAADMDFDQRIVERNLFEPADTADGLVRSVQELEEVFRGEGAMVGGPPTQGDIPGYPTGAQSGPQEYSRTEVTRNVEINQIQERIVVAPGMLKRLSVAVVINRDLTEAESLAVEETVSAAIGYDPNRSDQVMVTGMSFDTSWMDDLVGDDPVSEPAPGSSGLRLPHYIGAGVGAGLLALLAMRWRRKGKKARAAAEPQKVHLPKEVDMPALMAAIEKRTELSGIESLVKGQPEAAAQLIQAWLAEDQA